MDEWTDVAPVDDFPAGTVRTVDLDGTPVAVVNVDGRYHAIEDLCSHEEETLSTGAVEGDQIICPRHGARFSLVTGAALSAPACEPVTCFPVRVEAGTVQVRDDRWD
ncbi:non-heme iron oxygenase ferredoxin subunit [Nitrogeniibacter mangrovi]|uniref:Non-heme iron oxygenase ferredoxin subunit n=1 Tax=Nitrogeniibacter mangrovi TaxID=2016596 RepID=A0A6C1AZU4_9RHOO|nr:non-heme iron oxygenase ferredoxin subunit [Nitrogeniibacter mangrovi]QID16165.1 non-heme iron oxygenase ferredoxin subunit [Nitrogeniibacter mangrovi]